MALARVIVSQRGLVLLEEPEAHLDEATATRVLGGLLVDSFRAVVAVSQPSG